MPSEFTSLVVVVVAVVPILVGRLAVRLPLPRVVLLLVAGIVIGPFVLGWAKPLDVSLLSSIGLGFLFLLARYELDPLLLRQRASVIAEWSWLVSLCLALLLMGTAYAFDIVGSPIVGGIALTAAALGTLLRIAIAMLIIPGVPALFFYRRELPPIERVQLMFLTATSLPLLIALSTIGVAKGSMLHGMQASIIGAGVLSVLFFPLIALTLQRRKVGATYAAATTLPSEP